MQPPFNSEPKSQSLISVKDTADDTFVGKTVIQKPKTTTLTINTKQQSQTQNLQTNPGERRSVRAQEKTQYAYWVCAIAVIIIP